MTYSRRIFLCLAAACIVLPALKAQNFNPQVEVTNNYATSKIDAVKQGVEMALPDSVQRFDLKFNYSVFDNPYKGSYEFSPYAVRLVPEPAEYDGKRFYLRAGAGYPIFPELRAAYSVLEKPSARVNLFQDFSGYAGNYIENGFGYDLTEKLVGTGAWDLSRMRLKAAAHYDGIYSRDANASGTHTIGASARFQTNETAGSYFMYDLGTSFDVTFAGYDKAQEYVMTIDGTMGAVSYDKYRFLMDFTMGDALAAGNLSDVVLFMDVTPKFQFVQGPVDLSLGVKVSSYTSTGIAPDAHASVGVFKNRLSVYADVTGGKQLVGYSGLRSVNHFFTAAYLPGSAVFHTTTEKLNASLGFRGRVRTVFQYDVKGGWASMDNAAMMHEAGFLFRDYKYSYADLKTAWNSRSVDAELTAHFRKTDLGDAADVFDLPMFSGDAFVRYNWNRRIFAGATGRLETARKGCGRKMPAYLDLGLDARYAINTRWSVWGRAGNLLNSRIEAVPGHSYRGVNFTAGICLEL